jgi:purine-binding chemotaxis protein CheW
MSTMIKTQSVKTVKEVEFVTFYVGDLLIGVDILHVEEINRLVNVTSVPQAPPQVSGVINLRGEVVTVVDLSRVLGMGNTEIGDHSRTVVINSGDEQIGLLVDQIADVVLVRSDQIEPPPANVSGSDGRFFKGLFKLETELLVILEIDKILELGSVNN